MVMAESRRQHRFAVVLHEHLCYRWQTYLVMSAKEGAVHEEALDWQEKFQDLMAQRADSFDDVFSVYYFTGRSLSDALKASVSGDIFLFIITCGFL